MEALSSTEQLSTITSRMYPDTSKQLNLLSCWPASVPPPAKELMALYRAPQLRGSSCTPARGVTAST